MKKFVAFLDHVCTVSLTSDERFIIKLVVVSFYQTTELFLTKLTSTTEQILHKIVLSHAKNLLPVT